MVNTAKVLYRRGSLGQSLVEFTIVLLAMTLIGLFIGSQFNPGDGAPKVVQQTATEHIAND